MKKKISSLFSARLFLASILSTFCSSIFAQNYTMSSSWAISAGTVNWFSSSANTERGMAYNPTTGHLLVVSLNAADGSSNNLLNITGITTSGTSITFALNQIGVASDGAIYAADLTSPAASTTNNFIVYRWANETATPTIAFQGSVGTQSGSTADRYGDSFAVTGSGINTMLAAGANAGGGLVVLTTPDGMNFTAQSMTNTTATGGDLQPGLDFYSTTTYFDKHAGGVGFHYSSFNLGATPPTSVELTTNSGGAFDSSYGPLKVSAASNWVVSLRSTTSTTGHYVGLFNISGSPFGNLTYVTSNQIVATAGNGNLTGAVAINGSNVYVLDTDAAIGAFEILPVVVLTPPTATVSPSTETEYIGNPGFSFTAVPSGSLPISYQWYITTNNVTKPIPGATNISYSFANATTNMAGSYSVSVSNGAGTNISAAATLTVQSPFTTGRMTNLWSLQPGSRFYLDNASYAQRGLAYDSVTGDLLVASRYPTNLIAVLNSTNGADKWLMNVDPTVITGNNTTYPLNTIGVDTDGVVYGVPLVVAGQTGFELYLWTDDTTNSAPELAYTGDPGLGTLQRWGDSMAVTESGGTTMILLGPGGETNAVAVLVGTSTSGFSPTVLTVTDPNNSSLVGFAQLGVAWGAGNTFWTKSISYNLRQIQYNISAGTATVLANYSTPFQGTQGTAIGVDVTNSLLAMLAFDNPPSVRLYDIWFTTQHPNVTPVMVDQQLFPVNYPNQNFNGAVAFADPYFYVLDSNNGVEAYKVDTSTLLPFSMGAPAIEGGTNTLLTWQSQPGRAYQVQYETAVGNTWASDGALVASSANSTSFTDTNNPTVTNGFFQVIGR